MRRGGAGSFFSLPWPDHRFSESVWMRKGGFLWPNRLLAERGLVSLLSFGALPLFAGFDHDPRGAASPSSEALGDAGEACECNCARMIDADQ